MNEMNKNDNERKEQYYDKNNGYRQLIASCFQFYLLVLQFKFVHLMNRSQLIDLFRHAFIIGRINQIDGLMIQQCRILLFPCIQQKLRLHFQSRQVIVSCLGQDLIHIFQSLIVIAQRLEIRSRHQMIIAEHIEIINVLVFVRTDNICFSLFRHL